MYRTLPPVANLGAVFFVVVVVAVAVVVVVVVVSGVAGVNSGGTGVNSTFRGRAGLGPRLGGVRRLQGKVSVSIDHRRKTYSVERYLYR